MEDKNKKFKRLAEKRVNNVIKQVQLIGNLSNRSNYDYSREEVNKIIKVLKKSISDLESKFDSKNDEFKL